MVKLVLKKDGLTEVMPRLTVNEEASTNCQDSRLASFIKQCTARTLWQVDRIIALVTQEAWMPTISRAVKDMSGSGLASMFANMTV